MRKGIYQLDMINCAIADPAGVAVSIDVTFNFLGKRSREELMVVDTSHTNVHAPRRKKRIN